MTSKYIINFDDIHYSPLRTCFNSTETSFGDAGWGVFCYYWSLSYGLKRFPISIPNTNNMYIA